MEEEVKAVVFDLGGDKALGPDVFPLAFFQQLCELTKKISWLSLRTFTRDADYLNMRELHSSPSFPKRKELIV